MCSGAQVGSQYSFWVWVAMSGAVLEVVCVFGWALMQGIEPGYLRRIPKVAFEPRKKLHVSCEACTYTLLDIES